MKKTLPIIITTIIILTLSVLSIFLSSPAFTDNQIGTLKILLYICLGSALYCFIVGEIANNNSQMDKLWSILPIIYTWVMAIMGGFKTRLVLYAIIATLWGIRLTFNFARKGAYSIKFWTGKEDYRWEILRKKKPLNNRFVWMVFDLFFISIYQNAIVLAICLPMLATMESNVAFNFIDVVAISSAVLFFLVEVVADEEQWVFQQKKKELLKSGKVLDELESPYNLGFNTTGLWGHMRHPNYLGEQGIWLSLFIFVIASGEASYGIFHITIIGPLFLVLLFLGSSTLSEAISSKKYPKYKDYQDQVFKYLPVKKFKEPLDENNENLKEA